MFVLADTYGRRSSVILGFVLIGTGYSFEGAVLIFAAVKRRFASLDRGRGGRTRSGPGVPA